MDREAWSAAVCVMQTIGPWRCPVAYLSKRLDPVAAGWPPRLWALAATVVLVREADKPTLGTNINVKVPHAVTGLMNSQGHTWLTSSRMTRHQRLLWETHRSNSRLCRH